ncbi:MAG: hypothetical protein HBSAPP02_07780 [Phycisphaerae bacterium]|nr:MAG: hypothetical protein HRU71_00340 [Planctomycetia bacterium]GJQ25746.1 MAG: hypothetical protein HBSAPP02_07780 [Phycisphaerae bacterium]
MLGITWTLAMAALVHRDVLPYWLAEDSPGRALRAGDFQTGIFNERGDRVGTTWVNATPTADVTTVYSLSQLDIGKVTGLAPFSGPLLLETVVIFSGDNTLDDFKLNLMGGPMPVRVSAERFGSDFACTVRLGDSTMTMPFDGRTSSVLSETLRPFTHMGKLHVGQSWRLRLLDPLALLKGEAMEFQTELARVTRREQQSINGVELECYRIETRGAIAWADDEGRILRQEVTLPFLGKWILLDEPYDAAARRAAMTLTRISTPRKESRDRSRRREGR